MVREDFLDDQAFQRLGGGQLTGDAKAFDHALHIVFAGQMIELDDRRNLRIKALEFDAAVELTFISSSPSENATPVLLMPGSSRCEGETAISSSRPSGRKTSESIIVSRQPGGPGP